MQSYNPSSLDIKHAVIGWQSMFYQSPKHEAELKPSHLLPIITMSNHFLNFSLRLALFSLTESESSQQASCQVAQVQPNKGL